MSQVAPSWCLLSSTFQYGNGIPKSLFPLAFFRPVQQLHTSTHACRIKHTIFWPSHFYPFLSISISFQFIFSYIQPFPLIFRRFEPFTALIQPFSTIHSHKQVFIVIPTPIRNIWKIQNLSIFFVFFRISSWDSVPLLMCYQMQAPH